MHKWMQFEFDRTKCDVESLVVILGHIFSLRADTVQVDGVEPQIVTGSLLDRFGAHQVNIQLVSHDHA
jgi:hypothetical protein